ncbi:MAG: phage tail protein [Acidobacteriota bacterium]
MSSIRFDASQVLAALDNLTTGTPRAIMRALNRAIASARTVQTKGIAGDTGIKQADIRKALKMTNATPNNLEASLSASTRPIPLIKYGARGPKPSRGKGGGVSYNQIGGGRATIPNAFIATMRSGHEGVYTRSATKFQRFQKPTWHKKRPAITERMGPPISQVFEKYRSAATARGQEIFATNFEREVGAAWTGTAVPSDPGINDSEE